MYLVCVNTFVSKNSLKKKRSGRIKSKLITVITIMGQTVGNIFQGENPDQYFDIEM